ncbi:MAG: septum formation initiator family protein [Patescibacteria group bacterium]
MLQKIKNFTKHPLFVQLRDIRVVGLLVFTGLVFLVSWSTVNVIQSNYDLQKKVVRLQRQNEVTDLENQTLKLRNEYLKTDQYLELTARRQFGLAAPGEKLVLVPKSVALRYAPSPAEKPAENQTAETDKPLYQRNFEAWMEFFFRK